MSSPRTYGFREKLRYASTLFLKKNMVADSPYHRYSTQEKLSSIAASLRQRLRPARTLIAGPFAGEFGVELMLWQGFVRAHRRAYAETHVLTYPGRAYLYEGCQTHAHDIDLKSAGYGYGLLSPEKANSLANELAEKLGLRDVDIFHPALLCTRYHRTWLWQQDFRLLEEPPLLGKIFDIAFHFRAVRKTGPDQAKNYTPESAQKLVSLCLARGWSVACIGHPDYAICPEGAEDLRRIDLAEGIRAIHTARLVAGENSGPMHLANLCGKPTLLWAHDPWRINYSLRWNPFRVPQFVVTDSTSQPEAEDVVRTALDALDSLRRQTDNFTRPCYTFPARPIAAA
jgi:hypothetical protein